MSRLVLIVAIFAGISSAQAEACSCTMLFEPGTPLLPNGQPVPTERELLDQQYLFIGTLISQVPVPDGLPEPTYGGAVRSVATFRLEGFWRGTLSTPIIRVYTPFLGGGCGYPFEPNTCYLVFAEVRDDGLLYTDICGRTAPYSNSGALLGHINAYFGPASQPIE